MRTNRMEWIDFCKGIGIIAMVWGHVGIEDAGAQYIHAWHMPIFFIISGYLFNTKSNLTIKNFILKKSKSFLIPYICFGLINTLYVWLYYADKNKAYSSIQALFTINSSGLIVSGALWFLTCIFFVEILFYIVFTKCKDKKLAGIIIILIGAIGYLYSKYIGTRLFWSFDISMSAIVFYYMGYLLKDNNENIVIKKVLNPTILKTICIVIVGIVLSFMNDYVDMRTLSYGNIILYYLNGFVITVGYIMISKLIVKLNDNKILKKINTLIMYIGANSIVYLVLNQIIIIKFQFVLRRIPSNGWVIFDLSKVIIIVIILTLASIIINKWFPVLIGKTNRIKSL